MFCVQCGKEVGDALSSSGLCHACFLEKNTFASIPERVDIEVCVHCRSRRRGELWVPPNVPGAGEYLEPLVVETVEEAVRVDPRAAGAKARVSVVPEDERNFEVGVSVSGVAEEVPFTEELGTRARIKNATCLRCSRIHGGYFESIVQLRAEKRDLTEEELRRARLTGSRVIERIVEEGDWNAFVLKDEEIHGGLDIYAGTTNAGRMIAKAFSQEFGARIRDHARMAGRRDGVDFYRITFALRLPEYRVGDIVVTEDTPHVVTALTAKNATLRALTGGNVRTLDHEALARVAVLKREEARDAVVVSREDGEFQVLDPWTYATVTVLAPADAPAHVDALPVVRWNGELHPLPASEWGVDTAANV